MSQDGPRSAELLASLPGEVTQRLMARAAQVRRAAGQTLFMAGDAGDGCYVIDEGLLKVELASESGAQRILAILRPGAVVGELALVDGKPRSATVTALRESRLRFISRATFDEVVARDPELLRAVAAVLAGRLRDTNQALATSNFMPVKGRVALAMSALMESFGQPVGPGRTLIKVKLAQGDIAAMAGVSRETASRILNEWLRAGDISRLAGYYCIERAAAIEAPPG